MALSPPSRSPHAQPVDPVVGIDLGTTNSLVAFCSESGPRILGGGVEGRIVPSIVRFLEPGRTLVGDAARRERGGVLVRSAKRLMGRSAAEVEGFARSLAAPVVPGPRGIAAFRIDEARVVTPQEVAAEVLRELRAIAEADLGTTVRKAVVTVPAYFDDAQRQATRDAARIAGLEVVRIVNEPTAASLAYGIGSLRSAERIVVFDLGGGTFDVTVLDIVPSPDGAGGADCFEVLATAGDTALGGDDVDRAIAQLWIEREGLRPSLAELPALVEKAEEAKVALSSQESVEVSVELGGMQRSLRLVRAEVDAAAGTFVARTIDLCARALREAKTDRSAVNRVILVGGSTRLSAVRAAAADFFGIEPYIALDPDRVVALGASVQAAIVAGGRKDLLLLDVIPLSLGIETVGGAVAKLIMRNSPIPARAHEHFSTSKDGQTSIRIHVLQGERELAEHCRSLGTIDLRGVPPMPAGIPQVEVTFLVDQNGVLSVKAREKRSGQEASIQVVPAYGLTQEEVDRIEQESVEHARADMTLHRVIDLRVHAELDLKWIGEALARVRPSLEPGYVDELSKSMDAVRALCDSAAVDPRSVDADGFHRAKQALDVLSMRVHEASITQSLRGDGTGLTARVPGP